MRLESVKVEEGVDKKWQIIFQERKNKKNWDLWLLNFNENEFQHFI